MSKPRITVTGKRRCWIGEVYGEENAQNAIDELNRVFVRFCYIKHDRFTEKEGDKGVHWHFYIDYGAPTTLKFMRETFGPLFANGYIEGVIHPWNQYKYLWHSQDIENAKGKFIYDEEKDIKKYNGFDPEELKGLTETERMQFMDCLIEMCNSQHIIEYSTLLETLSGSDRTLYRFAINNTNLLCKYVQSVRHRKKEENDMKSSAAEDQIHDHKMNERRRFNKENYNLVKK